MKKTKHLLFTCLIVILCFINQTVKAQNYYPFQNRVIPYHGYQFSVFPESSKWQQLSYQERISMLQIPEDTLRVISTSRLLETCIYYPFNIDILASEDYRIGFAVVRKGFNGFNELYKRSDCIQQLIAYYESQKVSIYNQISDKYDKGRYSFNYLVMEMLILEVVNLLTENQCVQIAKLLVQKRDERMNQTGHLGFSEDRIIAFMIGKCFFRIGQLADYNGSTLFNFLEKGVVKDKNDLDYLFNKARTL